MPHLVILYTPGLDADVDMPAFTKQLADTLLTVRDEADKQVFPTGGVRVLAYPAAHSAVGDSAHGAGFVYFNLRMAQGRSSLVHQRAGDALKATVAATLAPVLARRPLGVTIQIDEGHEVYDAKIGNLHALYAKGP